MKSITEHAPAKLNLFLHILGKRQDGYHDIESLMIFLAFGDWVTLTPASQTTLSVSGPFAVDMKGPNILVQTLNLLNDAAQCQDTYAIHLEKNIPVGAGLGGGSADAGALIRAYQKLKGIVFSDEKIRGLALQLGADVMPCYYSRPLIARGIGDDIVFVSLDMRGTLLLVKPLASLGAGDVYKKGPTFSDPKEHQEHIDLKWLLGTCNDLSYPAQSLVPELEILLRDLETSKGCVFARMSGSGTVCFGLYNQAQDAALAEKRFKAQGYWCAKILLEDKEK